MTTKLKHSTLGEITGLDRGDSIVQFRGVPYASISARFRQSVLSTELPTQPFDATQTGPFCPQPFLPSPAFWEERDPSRKPGPPAAISDEFKYLNLNVAVPRKVLTDSTASKVPVLVFIHGGAYVGGSQSLLVSGRELFDPSDVIHRSLTRNQDIIVVTLNYRVGPLGFLASRELTSFNKSNNEPVGNYGLHDQRQALEWLSTHISGFGGDRDNITLHGTSAGASSAHFHCPSQMDRQQARFDEYVKHLRDEGNREPLELDAVSFLQSIPENQLVNALRVSVFQPLAEADWILSNTMETIMRVENPPDILVGSCAFEQDIAEVLLSHIDAQSFNEQMTMTPLPHETLTKVVESIAKSSCILRPTKEFPYTNAAVLEAYGLHSTAESSSVAFESWAQLVADLIFRVPPLYLALMGSRSRVLMYECQATNPYTAVKFIQDRAHHGVNDLILFNAAADLGPSEKTDTWKGAVDQLQAIWLDFCYGLLPWQPLRQNIGVDDQHACGPVYVIANGGSGGLRSTMSDAIGERDWNRWKALLDACHDRLAGE